MIKDKRILITGVNGFIGNNLYNKIKPHNEIIELDRDDGGLTNRPLVIDKCRGVNCVFHLGAISTVPSCEKDKELAHSVNVTGHFNLLKAALDAKVDKVIFPSSAAVYDVKSFYAATKSIGEKYCQLFTMYGLPVVILRLFNVYGATSLNAVIPIFVKQLKQGNEVVIFGDGTQTRDFIYINDVVEAMIQSMEEIKPGIYNIGTGKETNMVDLANKIGRLMGKEVSIKHIEARSGDIERSRALIPEWFKPRYSLEEGLNKTIEDMK
jgi:UDP-glucose 4-epimerase